MHSPSVFDPRHDRSLVAIGACIFTVVSQVGFSGSDNSRVAASVASGVGFIGAGVSGV